MIKTLQRKGRQIGEIRIGHQVATGKTRKDGTQIMRPAKLDKFRLTTRSETIAQAVANMFGGQPREITLANGATTWEVYTEVDRFDVMVPPGDAAISQWLELWSGGGISRRCDGETEQLTQGPCQCPSDGQVRAELAAQGKACKPLTRVNVMLPDLPDLGVWLVTSGGYYAADWLGGTAEVLAKAREGGVIVPAALRIEPKRVVRGGVTRDFAVPVLELRNTLRELTALDGSGGLTASLPPPPPPRAITAGDSATPGATAQRFATAQDIADAATRATSPGDILALGKAMNAHRWDTVGIVTADGEQIGLRDWLLRRHTEVQQDETEQPTQPEPVDPDDVPEYNFGQRPDGDGDVVDAHIVEDEQGADQWQT